MITNYGQLGTIILLSPNYIVLWLCCIRINERLTKLYLLQITECHSVIINLSPVVRCFSPVPQMDRWPNCSYTKPEKNNKNDIEIHFVSLWDGIKINETKALPKEKHRARTNANKKLNILDVEHILQSTYNRLTNS